MREATGTCDAATIADSRRRAMPCRLLILCWALPWIAAASGPPSYRDFDQPPHNYWQREVSDPFSRLKADIESGKIALDRSSEKAFLLDLLKALDIPASSQMLVFSTTSLQLRLINPRNPRALYFSEEAYLGFIPGGRIEIVSIDPDLGGIFFIMDIPRGDGPPVIERSTRCMNCHGSSETRFVPGLAVKSVVPGPNGGTLESFRQERAGHDVPFEERFGGWYLTGNHGITNHWGNLTGRLFQGELTKFPIEPGARYRAERYPRPGSDILPQLVHEHQAGFVNRVLEATYRTRTALHLNGGRLTADHEKELDDQARQLTRYLLFADEPRLPGPVEGDAGFKQDFLKSRRAASNGASLKDFDLRTRLFKHRCSYMIHSRVFGGLPPEMKQRVHRRLAEALNTARPDAEYSFLPDAEKSAICTILKETISDLPAGW
jgi:hypothetical protein